MIGEPPSGGNVAIGIGAEMDTPASPYVCPYCGGPKSYSAHHCIKCQALAVEQYRQRKSDELRQLFHTPRQNPTLQDDIDMAYGRACGAYGSKDITARTLEPFASAYIKDAVKRSGW